MSGTADTPPLVRTERREDVELVWMSDSARRNALSVRLVVEMIAALRASRAAGARAVVIASREKAFCAGADIADMMASGWLEATPGSGADPTPPDLFEAIEADGRPILAAVDGLALGGGVELCLACDLVYASAGAAFMFPELGLGVLPNTALARLPTLIGARAAADLILTRRRVDGPEALRLGLITGLTEADAVDTAVRVAQDMVGKAPPAALAAAKRHLRRPPDWPAIKGVLADMSAAEWREGVSAFLEKRSPDYRPFWDVQQPA